MQDDHLDVYGDVKTFGKNIGGDIISNKKTFLLISALQLAKGEQKERLLAQINATDFDYSSKIDTVKEIYEELNIEQLVKAEIIRYIDMSVNLLNNLNIEEERKIVFYEMVNILKDRIY